METIGPQQGTDRDRALPHQSAFVARFAASSIFLIAVALGMRYPLAFLAAPLAVGPLLLLRRGAASRAGAHAPALAEWVEARRLLYQADCPAYSTPVLLRAGKRQAFGDLASGIAVGELECELFNFDWMTIGSDSYGRRWWRDHRALVLRTRLPERVPIGFMSLEQRRRGPLARVRDRIWMPALRGASDVDIRAVSSRLRLRVLDSADPALAAALVTPELATRLEGAGADNHLLTLQIEGDCAAVFASKAVWSAADPGTAEWMIQRAGPILLAAEQAVATLRS